MRDVVDLRNMPYAGFDIAETMYLAATTWWLLAADLTPHPVTPLPR
jgi:hypothetical protein